MVPQSGHTQRRVELGRLGGLMPVPYAVPGVRLPVPVPVISAQVKPSDIWIACQPCASMKSSSSKDGLVMVQPYFS